MSAVLHSTHAAGFGHGEHASTATATSRRAVVSAPLLLAFFSHPHLSFGGGAESEEMDRGKERKEGGRKGRVKGVLHWMLSCQLGVHNH